MRHYRIRTQNGWYTINDERDMTTIGEIYKDRLVGETDSEGHLRDIYIPPELEAAITEAAKEMDWEKILTAKGYTAN